MADLNKVFLMGRLTADPELRRIASGTAVTELRLATTRSWSGRDGERREETLFIGVNVWDRQAETCCQYLRKGSPIHVEGYLRMDTWDDKATGEKRSKILVHADRVQFLESRRGESSGGSDDYGGAPASREPAARRGGAPSQRPSAAAGDAPRAGNGASHPAPGPESQGGGSGRDDADFDDIPF
jgi:single-strand DNA-binding protein